MILTHLVAFKFFAGASASEAPPEPEPSVPYPAPAGRSRGRPRKLRRWLLPNGMHVFADAYQVQDLAEKVSDAPVVVRTEKPKKPVLVKVSDGGYVEATVVYPVERQEISTAEPLAALTQTAGINEIYLAAVQRMMEADEQKRQRLRRRKAAYLLLMS